MKAIRTKYHGPGNVKGARISATDDDGNNVFVSYDHSSSEPHDLAALALCAKMGWAGTLVRGSIKGGNVYVWCDAGLNNRIVAEVAS